MVEPLVSTEVFTVCEHQITLAQDGVRIQAAKTAYAPIVITPRNRTEAAHYAIALRHASKRLDLISKQFARSEAEGR